jgi:hypothetical protein
VSAWSGSAHVGTHHEPRQSKQTLAVAGQQRSGADVPRPHGSVLATLVALKVDSSILTGRRDKAPIAQPPAPLAGRQEDGTRYHPDIDARARRAYTALLTRKGEPSRLPGVIEIIPQRSAPVQRRLRHPMMSRLTPRTAVLGTLQTNDPTLTHLFI